MDHNIRLTTIIDAHAHPLRDEKMTANELPSNFEEEQRLLHRQAEHIISKMQQLQIQKKVMMAMPPDVESEFYYGAVSPVTGYKNRTSQEWIKEIIKLYPEHFYGIACLNPLGEGAFKELESLVVQNGFKGVKIHQGHYNISADDPRLIDFYKKCIDLDITVAFHTGFSPVQHIDRYITTMPLTIDELAHRFPELRIVMCHAGGNWFQDGIMIALRNKNVYVDLAGIPWLCSFLVYPEVDWRTLICRMVKVLGADRIIYGTDNMDDMMTPEMIMELDILEEEKHMILGGTAKRVYNL